MNSRDCAPVIMLLFSSHQEFKSFVGTASAGRFSSPPLVERSDSMRGQSFRLNTPTLGMFNDKDTTVVPADAIITVVSDPDSTNHVYALYEGRKILIFVRD